MSFTGTCTAIWLIAGCGWSSDPTNPIFLFSLYFPHTHKYKWVRDRVYHVMGEMTYDVGDYVTYSMETHIGSVEGEGEIISMDGADEGEVLIDSGVVQSVPEGDITGETAEETVLG